MTNILDTARFDAGVQTPDGREQFSFVGTAGDLIGNREYKEGFDKFEAGCPCSDTYMWRVLSAAGDEAGRVLYENVKNYVDYVANVDLCRVQSLRSMVKMFGLEYRVFDTLGMLPAEVLGLLDIFSINRSYFLRARPLLQEYRDMLSAEGVIFNIGLADEDLPVSSYVDGRVVSFDYPASGKYYDFIRDSFAGVISDFLSLRYSESSDPIYKVDPEVYDWQVGTRSKYATYQEGNVDAERRAFKILHGVSLNFDEKAALDRIEAGVDLESKYAGYELELVQMERERRKSSDGEGQYGYYKKRRVLEYASFVIDKYFTDSRNGLSAYGSDGKYFLVPFETFDGASDVNDKYQQTVSGFDKTKKVGQLLLFRKEKGSDELELNTEMIDSVAQSLADTALYISSIREKLKRQTQKNYMKGTYDLMLYAVNEFLVDYARTNPIFRDSSAAKDRAGGDLKDAFGCTVPIESLLSRIYADLSSHDIDNLTATEYFDSTEYYNISTATDARAGASETNSRFWEDPYGEPLFEQNGADPDFDIGSISKFYMDTLGMRSNCISDDAALCAFLGAVFNLGAVDSFIHKVSCDLDENPYETPSELFAAQVEKYGKYSDDLYRDYLELKAAWRVFTEYLSGASYDAPASACVSAQAVSAVEAIRQSVISDEMATVSDVYDAYIGRADDLSALIDAGVQAYNDLLSGQYSFYFDMPTGYKYCFIDQDVGNREKYRHEYYVSSHWDEGLQYWYDMIQRIGEFAAGENSPERGGGDNVTNWPIRDTVEYFRAKFLELSAMYVSMTVSVSVPELGLDERHNWSSEYGFVDISAVTLEEELKHGYDFMQDKVRERTEFIIMQLTNLKDQAIQLQSISQGVKDALAQAVANYKGGASGNGDLTLTKTSIYAVSINPQPKIDGEYPLPRCKRKKQGEPIGDETTIFRTITIGDTVYNYYTDDDDDSGKYAYHKTTVKQYNSTDGILDRCQAIREHMQAPTSFSVDGDGDVHFSYGLMDDGVYASINQAEADYQNMLVQIRQLNDQIKSMGYAGITIGSDPDQAISNLLTYITGEMDEDAIGKDPKIVSCRKFIKAIVQLSGLYLPVKNEYDAIYNDAKQRSYLADFQRDQDLTIAAMDKLSAYSVQTDAANKAAILAEVERMRRKYQEFNDEYNTVAEDLSKEYMLPHSFQPYLGYAEDMVIDMYDALKTDVEEKTAYAYQVAQDLYVEKLCPAASNLIRCISPYENSLYRLPEAVSKKLKELYYLDDESYLRQKEMFLSYGGRSYCYYPYYNFKNVSHPSYQVHPFLWNFVRRELAYDVVSKTFFSVNVDQLEAENIAENWGKYFGSLGETKYLDLSKARYPDYSGYQSRYESSNHVADGTQFVSEVVDYDGGFYPPAVEYMTNALLGKYAGSTGAAYFDKAVRSVAEAAYGQRLAAKTVSELSSTGWQSVAAALEKTASPYYPPPRLSAISSDIYNGCGYASGSVPTTAELVRAVYAGFQGEDTFYGRFYRQLKLDSDDKKEERQYIAAQLDEYFNTRYKPNASIYSSLYNGPRVQDIASNRKPSQVYDIYKYGIDAYGNMYCLYKLYNQTAYQQQLSCGGLSYRYKQNSLGELWIRLKDHPIAFPAFSGNHPNVCLRDAYRRHSAFLDLFDLYKLDGYVPSKRQSLDRQLQGSEISVLTDRATCMYDFEFTKDRRYVTFVTQFREPVKHSGGYFYNKFSTSRRVQNYQNPWLVMCQPVQSSTATKTGEAGRQALFLYSDSVKTDFIQSGDDNQRCSVLSSEAALSAGCDLYQYIGSYLKGDSGIYHVYDKKHVGYDAQTSSSVVLASGTVKILPVLGGVYLSANDITGILDGGGISVVGPDVCVAYDDAAGVLNFVAQTSFRAGGPVARTLHGSVDLSANADGPTIDDPVDSEMNSHDVFDTNVTLFRTQVSQRRLRPVRKGVKAAYEFNTNADMSYFPVYPGDAGRAKLYGVYDSRDYYAHGYNVELLGQAKDISEQISYVNPNPDPYLDYDGVLSAFANARVFQDYTGYVDETLKIVNNELIGPNSPAVASSRRSQSVVVNPGYIVWQISINGLYEKFDLGNALKLKVLIFNKKCYGKNAYLFSDVAALRSGWTRLQYDADESDPSSLEIGSAGGYTFSYANRVLVYSTQDGSDYGAKQGSNHIYNVKDMHARLLVNEAAGTVSLQVKFSIADPALADYTFVPEDQLQAVFLDVKNLDVFNYFHYLDAYGALRVVDYFKTMQEFNEHLVRRGDGWVIYYAGHRFTEEELLQRLRTYYEQDGRMIALSSVDMSEYDDLSDVYILQGSKRLQVKVDEDFRYELEHPSYFYPTLNSKFPMTMAHYAQASAPFQEDAPSALLAGLFGQNNLFMLDPADPLSVLDGIGKVDIPVEPDDEECLIAYEDYAYPAQGELSARRNCDLYGPSDANVAQFLQFEADSTSGVPKATADASAPFDVPDSVFRNASLEQALDGVESYAAGLGVLGVCATSGERQQSLYSEESVGFTVTRSSLTKEQIAAASRIYVNYRKCDEGGSSKIQLYFNYMNYLDSPYLKIVGGRPYVDTIDGTYLSLKPDEDGTLDVVAQFRYYRGSELCGCRNVKLASYRIYNVSDDKPKFVIKNVDFVKRGDASNANVVPQARIKVQDAELDTTTSGSGSSKMQFDLCVAVAASQPLKTIQAWLDYPPDFMEIVGAESAGQTTSGEGWSLQCIQPGYAKLTLNASARFASVPARTVRTKSQLAAAGDQSAVVYVDSWNVVGSNNLAADVAVEPGHVKVFVEQVEGRINVLLTQHDTAAGRSVFNTRSPSEKIEAFVLGERT